MWTPAGACQGSPSLSLALTLFATQQLLTLLEYQSGHATMLQALIKEPCHIQNKIHIKNHLFLLEN